MNGSFRLMGFKFLWDPFCPFDCQFSICNEKDHYHTCTIALDQHDLSRPYCTGGRETWRHWFANYRANANKINPLFRPHENHTHIPASNIAMPLEGRGENWYLSCNQPRLDFQPIGRKINLCAQTTVTAGCGAGRRHGSDDVGSEIFF